METVIAIFGVGTGSVLFTGIFTLIQKRMEIKAAQIASERHVEVAKEESLNALKAEMEILKATIREILHDRLKHLARKHIEVGRVSFEDKDDLEHMYNEYKNMSGNGTHVPALVKRVMELPTY